MICQTSVLKDARFFALHFPIVRFPFSHRDIIETNLQNLNIPSRVLLCRHLALSAQCREPRSALVFTLASPPLLGPRPADRPSIIRPPPAERRRRGQSGGRWGAPAGPPAAPRRSPPLPAAPLRALRRLAVPLQPLRSPRPEPGSYMG
ncbi:lysine-rich arabinogalactan protein 19-like isoform X2 [Lutra lutra]|uniref:lysine-rich arabinogalactan protein 19-like isoform X2 n=1 Tax=Lutra lutra TaxID=9657 RepID=UPI001FD27644|nr:lysine-rich arabinogalactan protein 19-like isoform X2 [Lutra lutra]